MFPAEHTPRIRMPLKVPLGGEKTQNPDREPRQRAKPLDPRRAGSWLMSDHALNETPAARRRQRGRNRNGIRCSAGGIHRRRRSRRLIAAASTYFASHQPGSEHTTGMWGRAPPLRGAAAGSSRDNAPQRCTLGSARSNGLPWVGATTSVPRDRSARKSLVRCAAHPMKHPDRAAIRQSGTRRVTINVE